MAPSSLARFAAGALLMAASARAALEYQGCVSIDNSAFTDSYTNPLSPESPETCSAECNSNGYEYVAISAQYVPKLP